MNLSYRILVACATLASSAAVVRRQAAPVDSCPGYTASNVVTGDSSVTADLKLAGDACNAYGEDLIDLKLEVEYQTNSRLHVKISDAGRNVYQVPESVVPRPTGSVNAVDSALEFSIQENPFSFAVKRKGSNEVLFNTSGSNLIFESQYLRLRTQLPSNPNIYGLGEHTNTFRLPTQDFIRTLWNIDRPFVPPDTNLYGSHPVYFDHRGQGGTHGVFLLNSNGMDVKLNSADGTQYLEYNTVGGVVDLYFMAGPTPTEVSKQYAEVVGLPAFVPYWSLGFQQCKYGWRDYFETAEVLANYSNAGIPLEVLWNDIDYMDRRRDFTLDPERYPAERMKDIQDYIRARDQKLVMMTNPAIAVDEQYGPFTRGRDQDVFLKLGNGSEFIDVVWPGAVTFPDWFTPNLQSYWNKEIADFFVAESGTDVDGMWIDMNEAAAFCNYPCPNPFQHAIDTNVPPAPPPVRPDSGRPINGFPEVFQPDSPDQTFGVRRRQAEGEAIGLGGRDLLFPKYKIRNDQGDLSQRSITTDVKHVNGYAEYDVHNLYGRMMSIHTRDALLNRRPGKRPFIISRSTFPGTGTDVGHWLGDNASRWEHYRFSISGLLQFASLYQVPMVGSDVCGFNEATTEKLCARWATLGAFSPFYRNHADITAPPQEFYLWPSVTDAAKKVIDIRYRMLDYIYTAFWRQTQDGTPLVSPMWFSYPGDSKTFGIDLQYFYGPHVLVSPVTGDEATSVDIYLPDDVFYEFGTGKPVESQGGTITLSDVPFEDIPLHIRGGAILPLRAESANTTTALREKDFVLTIAPGRDGKASGELYLDDGESLESAWCLVKFSYESGTVRWEREGDFKAGRNLIGVNVLGGDSATGTWSLDEPGEAGTGTY